MAKRNRRRDERPAKAQANRAVASPRAARREKALGVSGPSPLAFVDPFRPKTGIRFRAAKAVQKTTASLHQTKTARLQAAVAAAPLERDTRKYREPKQLVGKEHATKHSLHVRDYPTCKSDRKTIKQGAVLAVIKNSCRGAVNPIYTGRKAVSM